MRQRSIMWKCKWTQKINLKMNLHKIVLLGLILFRYGLSEDCSKSGASDTIIVKTSDSITFHFVIDDSSGRPVISDFHAYFKVERVHVQNEPIAVCNFAAYVEYHNDTYHIQHGDCSSPQYGNRTTIVVSASFSYNFYRLTDLDFTILKAESTDTGTYMITTEWRRKSKCYDVFVLGENFTGPPEIAVIPPIIETGASGRFRCISTSTNQTSWLLNYTAVEKQIGRFEIDDKDLLIHYVSRADKTLLVSCRAVEDCGLTTMANMTVPVGWGPDPVPELRPNKIFYNLEPGTLLPHINCSPHCNPPCEMRWEKIGSQRTLSTNGTLSLGKLDTKSSGEYVCIATRNQTHKTGRTSVIVFVNEETPITEKSFSQNHVPAIVVGGVLGAALLAAFVFIVVLVRRIGCGAVFTCSKAAPKRENRAAEVELQSTSAANYEELNQRSNATPTYDELNLGVGTTGCESVSMAKGTTTGTEVYENTRKTKK